MHTSPLTLATYQHLVDDIIAKGASYLRPEDTKKIQQAYTFAFNAHVHQKRFSGEPYIIHPLTAATILMNLQPDVETIIACILHDIPENTEHNLEEIRGLFGEEIMQLVQGIVDMSTIRYRSKDEMEVLKQLGLALVKDIRIVFIKLSERLHNIQTLHHVPSQEKQKRIAEETLYVYAPIANRLGLVRLKAQLEDACFQFLYPEAYHRITTYLSSSDNLQQQLLDDVTKRLHEALQEQGITADISVRRKTPYSIFVKMKRKGTNDITEIKDLLAARIIVSSRGTCYKALGVVHQHWTPITSRIKDYIAKPKANNYQSIHTVIKGMFATYPSQTLEIQIRSRAMHEEAEYGNAAYAVYKEKGKSTDTSPHRWVQKLKESMQRKEDSSLSFFEDQIFVITPDGDIIILPVGATPVDFAYTINPTIGDTCIAAKVNGQRVSLDYHLKTGEYVEIITSQEPNPNPTWLSFVVTPVARQHIKKYLHSQDAEDLEREGQLALNEQLKKHHLPLLTKELNQLDHFVKGKTSTLAERKQVLIKIATYELPVQKVVHYLQKESTEQTKRIQNTQQIIIDGEANIPSKIALCCHPTTKDAITGYTTRGKYISIHKSSCAVLRHLDQSRFLPASWDA